VFQYHNRKTKSGLLYHKQYFYALKKRKTQQRWMAQWATSSSTEQRFMLSS